MNKKKFKRSNENEKNLEGESMKDMFSEKLSIRKKINKLEKSFKKMEKENK